MRVKIYKMKKMKKKNISDILDEGHNGRNNLGNEEDIRKPILRKIVVGDSPMENND